MKMNPGDSAEWIKQTNFIPRRIKRLEEAKHIPPPTDLCWYYENKVHRQLKTHIYPKNDKNQDVT